MENGVVKYIKAKTTVYFPEGHVCCDLCPLLETYTRKQCRKTGEYLIDTKLIGNLCPLEINGDFTEVKNEKI